MAPLEWLGFGRRSAGEVEADILDELRFHVEECEAELVRDGLPADEAQAEARRRFGDLQAVRTDCRRVQLGGRVLAQRITSVLVVVFFLGLVFTGWLSLSLARQSRARLEQANAELAAMHARLSSGEDVGAWLARFQEHPDDWRDGLSLTEELAERNPARAIEQLEALWPDLSLEHREQAFKPFVFGDRIDGALRAIHLGVRDPAPSVRARALGYLKRYAFQDLSGDLDAAERWFERWEGRPAEEVLIANARAFVHRLKALSGDDLARQRRELRQLDLRPGGQAGVDLAAVLREEGIVDLVRGWIAGDDDEAHEIALAWLAELDTDEATQRELVLPILANPAARPSATGPACRVLGQPGNTWAVEPLLDAMVRGLEHRRATPERDVLWNAAEAVADIGDERAVPTLIGMIAANDAYDTIYGVGYFGLHRLTGVDYDESHDGAWWLEWWQRNRHRLPPEVAALEIPSLRFDR